MKGFSKLFISLLILISREIYSKKIIWLISPPRSMSVAFLRMMQSRGDFKIFHEPCIRPFDDIYYPELTKEWFEESKTIGFSEVKANILREAANNNVFIKEMSFALKPFLLEDEDLVSNTDIRFVFLLRNPHHTTISFYNKIKLICDNFSYVIGYKACYNIFEHVKKNAKNNPVIIFTEDLYSRPKETIENFCKAVEIDFNEKALEWESLGETFTGREIWHESKKRDLTQHWHGDAIKSTGFGKPHNYKVDNLGNPTFEEIENRQDRLACEEAYKENLVYYNLMLLDSKYFLKNNKMGK